MSGPRLSRKSGLVAAGVAAALALTACSGGTGDADGPITLTFASWQWLEPERGEALWEAMTAYQDSHSDVTLEQQAIPRAQYESTLQTQIGAGGGPDLLIVPPAFLYQAGSAGILAPLDGVLDASVEEHLASSNDRGVYEGERLGYTWEAVNWALIWNKSILEDAGVAPPTTPEELLAAAEQLTESTGNPSLAVRHQLNEAQPWWNDFASWPCGFDGGWSTDGELTISSPENVAAVQLLKDLYDAGVMPVGDDASTFRNRFANGEIAMMIDNASVAYTVTAGEDNALGAEDIGTGPLPFPTQNSSQIVNFIGVNANSEHADAAKDFISWLFSDEGQQLAAETVFPSTVGTDAAPPAELLDANSWVETYRTQAETSLCSPLVDGFELQTPDISTIVMTQIASVLAEDVPAQDALDRAQEEAEMSVG